MTTTDVFSNVSDSYLMQPEQFERLVDYLVAIKQQMHPTRRDRTTSANPVDPDLAVRRFWIDRAAQDGSSFQPVRNWLFSQSRR